MVALYTILVVYITLVIHRNDDVDNTTKMLCMEYAKKDHEREIAPERWEWLKQFGDPNNVLFFYQSCLNHVLYPVAGEIR